VKPYDQDAWSTLADMQLSPLISLALVDALHTRLVAVARTMTDADGARTLFHPENGVMTVDSVLAMYAWHGDHHIAQLEAYRATRA
jgi:hypothetical protein